tara:strand:+ start:13735 stop:15111 length:1377 start_codon:yes stop_codon:yes gene_type:complete
MGRSSVAIALVTLFITSTAPIINAQVGQPDIVQEHWYHTYATLTLDVNEWADNFPTIVDLISAGQTEMGRNLWVLRISDWSVETKPNGMDKDVVYIDGGHHGNEHLGTELAFLTAEYYIEGWAEGNQEAIDVLKTTELHILIMLNADGNDLDTRWNVNQVDLNRNYDHFWNNCPPNNPTQPGSSAFSESETLANSVYMNTEVPDADLYVTMHTGVWIMLYPWGRWPAQPSDRELFHFIRDEVNNNISDIPIQNANQGLYPNCGTSRDYGYGVMGYPTFTFETDDEQFLLGSVEALSDRLDEELNVMKYLIQNVWYWRARLVVEDIEINKNFLSARVSNLGHSSTANATFHYSDITGELLWHSETFGVNATNESNVLFNANNLTLVDDGIWSIHYQKRVISSSQWVEELIDESTIKTQSKSNVFLPAPSLMIYLVSILTAAITGRKNQNTQTKSNNFIN